MVIPQPAAAGLVRYGDRMTVSPPPIEPAQQLFDAKAEAGELKGALSRGNATDSVAVDDIDLPAIETRVLSAVISRCGKLTAPVCPAS